MGREVELVEETSFASCHALHQPLLHARKPAYDEILA